MRDTADGGARGELTPNQVVACLAALCGVGGGWLLSSPPPLPLPLASSLLSSLRVVRRSKKKSVTDPTKKDKG